MAQNPVSDEHVKQFAEYVRAWQVKLGLADWRINVSRARAKGGVMAVVQKMDFEQRQATIRMGSDFGAEAVTDETLEATAVHELLHIMFCEVLELAKLKATQGDALRSAEHRLINIFERLLVLEKGDDARQNSPG